MGADPNLSGGFKCNVRERPRPRLDKELSIKSEFKFYSWQVSCNYSDPLSLFVGVCHVVVVRLLQETALSC